MAFNETLHVLTGAQTANLFITPLTEASTALQVASVIQTGQARYRIPRLTSDPKADWLGPNDEFPESEVAGDDIEIEPTKIGGIDYIANELIHDASPDPARMIGARIINEIRNGVDRAFFGPDITDPEDPTYNEYRQPGLESIPDLELQRITANPATSLDPWVDAFFAAEEQGATVDSWVTTPAIARALAKMKAGTGSNQPLMDFVNGRRTIYGAPVYTSRHVVTGTVWGLPKDRVLAVINENAELAFDKSVRFSRDQTAIRAKLRVGFGYPHSAAITKIKA